MIPSAYADSSDTISLEDTTTITEIPNNQDSVSLSDFFSSGILPMVGVLLIFYFLIIRPQDQKRKQHQQTISQAKAGQSVLLGSGIYGKISRVINDDQILVMVANGVELKCHRSAIHELIDEKIDLPASESKTAKKDGKKTTKKAKTK